ncbi:hypothetical protein GCM10022291_04410 [Postechiella marina]|uniref:Uncharacterized protein n=1 Tax=Postechiella marina TaxID=943941 RepID=A0ABP8C0U4_9FLAO
MNNKIKTFAVMLLGVFAFTTSCSEDEFSLYGDSLDNNSDFSSFKWYTSGTKTTARESEKQINLNTYVAFYDVSRNPLTHIWNIPNSANLLNTEFTESDSIYDKFIISGKSSQEDLVNVHFPEPGVHEVILSNTFKDSVTDAVKSGNEWVVNKVFTIDVFADPNPTGKVYRQNFITDPDNPTGPTILDEDNPFSEFLTISESDNPQEGDVDSWQEISIEAGETLRFEDLSITNEIGRVDGVKWYLDGGKPETSGKEIADITYNKLGDYTAWFESKRSAEAGPVRSVSKLIPLKIKVTKSSKPFKFNGGLKIDENGVISFSVTGEAVKALNQESKFKVHVVNTEAGFDGDIAVSSVSISTDDATVLELKLAEPVYNSDVVTVSYIGGAIDEDRITSVDERYLEDFADENLKMFFGGIMDLGQYTGYERVWGGSGNQFKKANSEGFWGQHNANKETGIVYYWRDTAQKYEGNSAMKFETSSSGIPALARLQGNKNFSAVEEGSYIPSVWVFLDPANTMKTIQYNYTTNVDATFNFDISTVARGKWVQVTLPIIELPNIDNGGGRLDINITNVGQDDAIVQLMWLDNFDLLKVIKR